MVATKPGVFAHGHEDPSATMLANVALTAQGRRVVSLSCGNGLVALAAHLGGASHVYASDRSWLAVEATTATLTADSPLTDSELAESRSANTTIGLGAGRRPLAEQRTVPIEVDLAFVRVVPERLAMLQLMWDALTMLTPGGRMYIAGGNDEGVKPAARWLESMCGAVRLETQRAGHRMVSAIRPPVLDVEVAAPDAADRAWLDTQAFREIPVAVDDMAFTLLTRPGVFSWEHLDEATAILLAELSRARPWREGARVLDLGCGAGAIGTFIALRDASTRVTMVDVDSEAVRCARQTVHTAGLLNAQAQVGDIASGVDGTFDLVVSNPPFHVGKHTSLDVPRQFIRDARARVGSGGALWLVANRTLPYESLLQDMFGAVHLVHDGARFKVLRAIAP